MRTIIATFALVLAAALALPATARADTAPVATTATAHPTPLRAIDLDGAVRNLGTEGEQRACAVVFLGLECPIAAKYIPTLNELAHARAAVPLVGVVSDPTATRDQVVKWAKEREVKFPLVFDGSGEIAARLKPKATPEALVLGREAAVMYRGRIDDLYRDLGKPNARVTAHELQDAIEQVASGKPIAVSATAVVGCTFEAWKDAAPPARPTYARDVAPLLAAQCVDCHHDGGIGPFSLTTYEEAKKHAKMIARVTESAYMPPWHADAGFGDFRGERRTSEREKAILAAWVAAGAPEGDAADMPPAPKFAEGWRLGEPTFVVSMPQPFTVTASGPDIYRAFVLTLPIEKDEFVVGVEFRPGAPSVVHHALFFLDTTGAGRQKEQQARASEPGAVGYRSFGGPGFTPSGGLGGWAPGATHEFLPEGMGRRLQKGSDLVLQVHYHPSGKEEHDQSKVAIYLAKKPIDHIVVSLPLITRQIDIPAGEAHYTRHVAITLPIETIVLGITPHMHWLGHEMKCVATKPDGTVVPLINVSDWDFRWQDQYTYDQPIRLPKGTKIDLDASYDNSAGNPVNPSDPPKRVTFGEQTTDEMCFCPIEVTTDNPFDLLQLLKTVRDELREGGRRRRGN